MSILCPLSLVLRLKHNPYLLFWKADNTPNVAKFLRGGILLVIKKKQRKTVHTLQIATF